MYVIFMNCNKIKAIPRIDCTARFFENVVPGDVLFYVYILKTFTIKPSLTFQ